MELIMGFETLLGNEQLKENLRSSIGRGRISHFYLISGPEGSGKHTLAGLLAAAILCKEPSRPCGSCSVCRRVLGSGHPDFITVDDPEKKTVPVDLVREARADIFIRPNEADHKIYLFPRAHDMREESQNALLKILEEPPGYGVFILLTNNAQRLLPTIRSRCTELSLRPLPDGILRNELRRRFPQAQDTALSAASVRSAGFLGQACAILEAGDALPPQTEQVLRAYAQKDVSLLIDTLAPMEKLKRDQLIPLLIQWMTFLEGALVYRSGMATATPMAAQIGSARSAAELTDAIAQLQLCIEYAQGNVSPGAICGHLLWVLR
jgi:DNA polymerase-3 subunit delta'